MRFSSVIFLAAVFFLSPVCAVAGHEEAMPQEPPVLIRTAMTDILSQRRVAAEKISAHVRVVLHGTLEASGQELR